MLAGHYNGAASSSLCPVPSQVIKHLAGQILKPFADFLTRCLTSLPPPSQWLTSKLTPLYKGKGEKMCRENYRALAVGHPMAKLASAVINQRLTLVADENGLRAKSQAGFYKGY